MSGRTLYAKVLRACQFAFKGDERTFSEARKRIRQEFSDNKAVSDPKKLQKLRQRALDIRSLLLHNVAQSEVTIGATQAESVVQHKFRPEHLLDNTPQPVVCNLPDKK